MIYKQIKVDNRFTETLIKHIDEKVIPFYGIKCIDYKKDVKWRLPLVNQSNNKNHKF